MKYESMMEVLRVLSKARKQLSVTEIRERTTAFTSDEGVRKLINQMHHEWFVERVVVPPERGVSPGRAKHFWKITQTGVRALQRYDRAGVAHQLVCQP